MAHLERSNGFVRPTGASGLGREGTEPEQARS